MWILEKAVAVIAPHTCLSCGREGALLCDWCMPDAMERMPERCYRCCQVSPDSKVCSSCRNKGSRLGHVWARCEYGGLAKELVHRLKFGRTAAAALPIGQLMEEALPWLDANVLIVPVPTASSRQRLRGYDHTVLIAREVARLRGMSQVALLSRYGQTRQVGATRAERLRQLEDVFILRDPSAAKGARILLVDDIVTTGGTLEAAASILRKAGARSVDALTFAQKS